MLLCKDPIRTIEEKKKHVVNHTTAPLTSRLFPQSRTQEIFLQNQVDLGSDESFANIPTLSPDPSSSLLIQPKLAIGATGDKYEQEADRVAEQVVQRLSLQGDGRSHIKSNQLAEKQQYVSRKIVNQDAKQRMVPHTSPTIQQTMNEGKQIQRMSYVLKQNEPGDNSLHQDQQKMLKSDPVEYRVPKNLDSWELETDEVLHLISHGDKNSFGGMNANQLHKFITGKTQKIPQRINLHGCVSSTIANTLQNSLTAQVGYQVLVKGYEDLSVTTAIGSHYDVKEENYNEFKASVETELAGVMKQDPDEYLDKASYKDNIKQLADIFAAKEFHPYTTPLEIKFRLAEAL